MPTDSGSLLVVGGIAVASFIGAFGVSLGIAKRRSPEAFSRNVARDQVNPARLAMRALGLGTILAIVGVSGLALAVKYTLGIKSVSYYYFFSVIKWHIIVN